MIQLDRLGRQFGRFPLFEGPTPLEPMTRLTEYLDGPNIFIKRDDCTGLAMGGNKTRKLEFVVAHALAEGADLLITNGGPQSNHARQTAAAAAKARMSCDLLLAPWPEGSSGPPFESGNVLLDRLLGAEVHAVSSDDRLGEGMARLAEQRAAEGRTPYIIDVGASTPLGSLGYLACADELLRQTRSVGIEPDWIVLATGSCGTQAGLLAGVRMAGASTRVIGVAVSPDGDQAFRTERVAELAGQTLELAGYQAGLDALVDVNGHYGGAEYGQADEATWEAIELTARLESILLDPVYTGKAMAGLIDLVRRGYFCRGESIVFLHSGGAPALFASGDTIHRDSGRKHTSGDQQ